MLLGRREDVQDAAAYGEVAALLDEVGAGISRRDEIGHDVGQLPSGVADLERHRRQLAKTGNLGLQHRPDRRNDHVEWSRRRIVRLGVRQPSQDRQSLPDRVRARREPFVGKRLPAGVDRNPVRVDQAAKGRREILGLPAGARDRQDRSALSGQRGDRKRCESPRTGHGQVGLVDCLGNPAQGRVAEGGVKQAGERHVDLFTVLRQHGQPPTGIGRGLSSSLRTCSDSSAGCWQRLNLGRDRPPQRGQVRLDNTWFDGGPRRNAQGCLDDDEVLAFQELDHRLAGRVESVVAHTGESNGIRRALLRLGELSHTARVVHDRDDAAGNTDV